MKPSTISYQTQKILWGTMSISCGGIAALLQYLALYIIEHILYSKDFHGSSAKYTQFESVNLYITIPPSMLKVCDGHTKYRVSISAYNVHSKSHERPILTFATVDTSSTMHRPGRASWIVERCHHVLNFCSLKYVEITC